MENALTKENILKAIEQLKKADVKPKKDAIWIVSPDDYEFIKTTAWYKNKIKEQQKEYKKKGYYEMHGMKIYEMPKE